MNAIPYSPALSLARLLRRRKIGARELLDLCWARVEKHNGTVNAIVVLKNATAALTRTRA